MKTISVISQVRSSKINDQEIYSYTSLVQLNQKKISMANNYKDANFFVKLIELYHYAIFYYNKAIQLDPNFAMAFTNKSQQQIKIQKAILQKYKFCDKKINDQKKCSDGILYFDNAILLDSNQANTYNNKDIYIIILILQTIKDISLDREIKEI